LLRGQIPMRTDPRLSPPELAEAWRQSTHGLPRTPPLSDEAVSREASTATNEHPA
jgi:hypothetical protein